jgi:hypothetical protein
MSNHHAAALLLVGACFSSIAFADTYVCQLPSKQRVYQNTPCSGGSQTLSAVGDNSGSPRSSGVQDSNAANARRELERQRQWMDQQQTARTHEESKIQQQNSEFMRREAAANEAARQEQLRREELARQEQLRAAEAAKQDKILRQLEEINNNQNAPRTLHCFRGVCN